MEGKFFKPLKQTGGESVQTYQNEMPNFISNTRVEFEKQTGGAVVVPPNIVLKLGIITYRKDEKKVTCFTVNGNNSNKIDKCSSR